MEPRVASSLFSLAQIWILHVYLRISFCSQDRRYNLLDRQLLRARLSTEDSRMIYTRSRPLPAQCSSRLPFCFPRDTLCFLWAAEQPTRGTLRAWLQGMMLIRWGYTLSGAKAPEPHLQNSRQWKDRSDSGLGGTHSFTD